MSMRRRYIYIFYLLTSTIVRKKEHITKYSIKSTINSTEAKIKLSFQNTAPELQPSVKLKIKHKNYREYAQALYIFYLLTSTIVRKKNTLRNAA